MAFSFSSTAGTSGITNITVSASSRQELTDIVENFTLSNTKKSLLMPIAQRAYEPLEKYIIFNPISISVDSSGGTASLNIQSNDNWVIVADDWIQLSRFSEPDRGPQTISGNGNTIVGIRFYENIGEARTGTISGYCTSNSSITATTTVSQAGSYVKPYLTLDKYVVNIPSSGMSSQTITVESNIDWYTMSDSRWIDINTQSGSGNGTISFDVQESEQNIGRTGIITVSGVSESLSAECYVQQSAVTPSEPYIVISPTYKKVQLSGGSFSITVSSNTDWDVAIIVNGQSIDTRTWLTVDKLNGYGDDVVEVTVNHMLSGTERTAYISFYNNRYALKAECNIKQKELDGKKIYYTTTGGTVIYPYPYPNSIPTSAFGANLTANTYENGQGIMWFDDDVTKIPASAFSKNSTTRKQLETIVIPETVETIEIEAFYDCTNLTGVTLSDSLVSIGTRAFSNCYYISGDLYLPDTLVSISGSAFSNCRSLSGSVIIPNSVNYIGGSAFYQCTGITYASIGDVQTNGSHLFDGCKSLTAVSIGNITVIGESMFEGCSALTSVVIPNSVTSIGGTAFFRCYSLTSVTIGNSVETIGSNAFYMCSGITEISIPNKVETIPSQTFYGCGITGLTIGSGVTYIESDAFIGNRFLLIYMHPQAFPQRQPYAISRGAGTQGVLHYPYGSESSYQELLDYLNINGTWTGVADL